MPERPDPMSLSHEAMNSGLSRLVETQQETEKKLATRPAVPLTDDPTKAVATEEQSKRERQMNYLMIREDEPRLGAWIAQLSVGLSPDKPYPRVAVEELAKMEDEYRQERGE